jgi:hypothetical protein
MPYNRKPPVEGLRRADLAPPADDTFDFSIETTTMRLKSLKLRRAEVADRELDDHLRASSRDAPETPAPQRGPAGRVRHDERGMAVWDMAVSTGEFAQLSATNIMRKLNIDDLEIEQTQRSMKVVMEEKGRDAGGGGDPYNQRRDPGHASQQYSRSGGNPYDSGASGDPYNQRAASRRPAPPMNRPAADKPAVKSSVLDRLTGKKK